MGALCMATADDQTFRNQNTAPPAPGAENGRLKAEGEALALDVGFSPRRGGYGWQNHRPQRKRGG